MDIQQLVDEMFEDQHDKRLQRPRYLWTWLDFCQAVDLGDDQALLEIGRVGRELWDEL